MEGVDSVQGIGVAIAYPRRRDTMEESELFSEVVVVGAGNAALTAALAAREAGAQVLVLEKAPYDDRGGNSRFTGGAVIQFWSGGPGLTNRLFRAAEGRGIDVVYDTPVLDLLTTTNGHIQGVRAQTPEGLMDIHAGAVILACGGFEASDTRRA